MGKRRLSISILSIALALGGISVVAFSTAPTLNAMAALRPSQMDCSYYFDASHGFTSIYDLNQLLKEGKLSGTYKSWGTVTAQWSYGGKKQTFIQSTDKNGRASATYFYNCNLDEASYPLGSVVEFEVKATDYTLYGNLPEITSLSSVSKVYGENPYAVEPWVISAEDWAGTSSPSGSFFDTLYSFGPRRAVARDVAISSVTSTSATATLNPGTATETPIKLYYSNVGDNRSISTAIYNRLNALTSNDRVTVYGFTQAYKNGANGYGELLLRSVDDIKTEKTLSSLSINAGSTVYLVGDEFRQPRVTARYSDGSSEYVSGQCSYSGYDLSSVGSQTVHVSFTEDGITKTADYGISVRNLSGLYSLTLDSSDSGYISSDYSTGNYGTFSSDYYDFLYYRAMGDKASDLVDLMAIHHGYTGMLGGRLSNLDPIGDIKAIQLTYKTALPNGETAPSLGYGEQSYNAWQNLPFSQSYKTTTIQNLHDVNYFTVEGGDCTMTLKSVKIYFTDEETSSGSSFLTSGMGSGQIRINAPTFGGSLVPGSTKIELPIEAQYINGTYQILKTKTYTYFSYDYVRNHPSVASQAAMTDPRDVSHYVSVFGQFPANYVYNEGSNYSNAYAIFGDDTRLVSTYSRNNGYVKSFPYANYGSTGLPRYHELDVKVWDSYGKSSRGTGRLVYLESGYTYNSYGGKGVCLFTDDHYSTFQEFDNLGGFLPRFNGEKRVTSFVWSEPMTLA